MLNHLGSTGTHWDPIQGHKMRATYAKHEILIRCHQNRFFLYKSCACICSCNATVVRPPLKRRCIASTNACIQKVYIGSGYVWCTVLQHSTLNGVSWIADNAFAWVMLATTGSSAEARAANHSSAQLAKCIAWLNISIYDTEPAVRRYEWGAILMNCDLARAIQSPWAQ